jgi:DNA gyrase/topoisomerase IV subunit B
MTATATYNASSITVLEGLDPVRKRPGAWLAALDGQAK